MNSIVKDVYRLMEERRSAGLARLPLSGAFEMGRDRRNGRLRPSSLTALYPSAWLAVRDRRMAWHRHSRRDGLRGRCLCCGRVEWDRYWTGEDRVTVRLQLAHMGWQPDDLSQVQLLPLCEQCHRSWDALHCDCAAALTLAGEQRLPAHVPGVLQNAIRRDVGGYGLVQLSPAVTDLAVALTLRKQGGDTLRGALPTRLADVFPEVVLALREQRLPDRRDSVEVSLEASLARLSRRRVAGSGQPLVTVSGQEVQLDPAVSLRGWVRR